MSKSLKFQRSLAVHLQRRGIELEAVEPARAGDGRFLWAVTVMWSDNSLKTIHANPSHTCRSQPCDDCFSEQEAELLAARIYVHHARTRKS